MLMFIVVALGDLLRNVYVQRLTNVFKLMISPEKLFSEDQVFSFFKSSVQSRLSALESIAWLAFACHLLYLPAVPFA